jgi:hypothetical protein
LFAKKSSRTLAPRLVASEKSQQKLHGNHFLGRQDISDHARQGFGENSIRRETFHHPVAKRPIINQPLKNPAQQKLAAKLFLPPFVINGESIPGKIRALKSTMNYLSRYLRTS